jgi:sugar phosphate isomerase/epimerase
MMELGIFLKTFVRAGLGEALDAVLRHGLTQIQFNLACVGLPTLPERIEAGIAAQIGYETQKRNINIAAVSGTYNMIHPDSEKRKSGEAGLRVLASACQKMGAPVITLCTGTRNTESMWKKHPENNAPSAWNDLLTSMEAALAIAEEYDLILAVEPEVSNVMDTAEKCRRLLDRMQSPRLKVVMDAANLFHAGAAAPMNEVMDRAFDLLGHDIIIAHAKDLYDRGEPQFTPAGLGILDYDHYIGLLDSYDYNGALIIHGLAENQVDSSVRFLKQKIGQRGK